jgi:diadenosine tetraphosphate (Ap4A) HIT family hydrolase
MSRLYKTGRSRADSLAYAKLKKQADPRECQFCDIRRKGFNEIVSEGKYILIIKSHFPYEFWYGQKVKEHLLAVPKRHVTNLAGLKEAELDELIELIKDYESRGYDFYGRSPTNQDRSVSHQHTHLIATR